MLKVFPAALGGACVVLSLLTSVAIADDGLTFTVMRNGDEIGTHEIEITSRGDRMEVEIETEVAVKLAFITVYNFDHEGHEVWQGGRLVSYESRTDDDGTEKSLRARAAGDHRRVSAYGCGQDPQKCSARTGRGSIGERGRCVSFDLGSGEWRGGDRSRDAGQPD